MANAVRAASRASQRAGSGTPPGKPERSSKPVPSAVPSGTAWTAPVPSGEFKSLDELESHSMEVEKRFFQNILQNCAGRIYGPNGAAQALNVKPTTLQSRLKKLGL